MMTALHRLALAFWCAAPSQWLERQKAKLMSAWAEQKSVEDAVEPVQRANEKRHISGETK